MSLRPAPAAVATPEQTEQSVASVEHAADASPGLIVCIGASAGGLDACSKLMDALRPDTGMAFILVQHLDPTHDSMMVDLLTAHTQMKVLEATHGMPIEPNHLYVIPPANDLTVAKGLLQLSSPRARHGTRLPFDILLCSVAEEHNARVACIILSGSGTDGNVGLRAVRAKGGLVIAQNPEEAGYAGMPRSAIETGSVDLVLLLSEIPHGLDRFRHQLDVLEPSADCRAPRSSDWLSSIIELLRSRTHHDFRLYKSGTLQRRIERRIAMASISLDDSAAYLEILQQDNGELDRLVRDLLINVTQFFRDAEVFEFLAKSVIPDLIRASKPDHPLRVWVAGCSTGEETYSLLMLFHEEIAKQGAEVKLQFFASDVDSEAIVVAREGLYQSAITGDVSADRLARFFIKEDHGYRILQELRASVVFAVQDVLLDPPFSRVDMVSCRNLLIYLGPEAQGKVVSLFRFALRPGGILLLGTAETAGAIEGRFEVLSKAARIYRRIGQSKPGEFGLIGSSGDGARGRVPPGAARVLAPKLDPGELVRRALLESYAPASIMINLRHECLFLFGQTD
ncbi:MAG: histidine kinase, partial [Proteobacteria bacterium]|nr:histidine kinase [Pseudomonadota bacterium]